MYPTGSAPGIRVRVPRQARNRSRSRRELRLASWGSCRRDADGGERRPLGTGAGAGCGHFGSSPRQTGPARSDSWGNQEARFVGEDPRLASRCECACAATTQCGQHRRPRSAAPGGTPAPTSSALKAPVLRASSPPGLSSCCKPRHELRLPPREAPPLTTIDYRADRVRLRLSPFTVSLRGRAALASPAARRGLVPCAHGRHLRHLRRGRCAVRPGLLQAAAAKDPRPTLVIRRGALLTSSSSAGRRLLMPPPSTRSTVSTCSRSSRARPTASTPSLPTRRLPSPFSRSPCSSIWPTRRSHWAPPTWRC